MKTRTKTFLEPSSVKPISKRALAAQLRDLGYKLGRLSSRIDHMAYVEERKGVGK